MTEYDFSPDAIERHLAKQAAIHDWVNRTQQHEPTNPFVPLPGEHDSTETYYSQRSFPSPPAQPQAQYPAFQYPQAQPQQPYPAYYVSPHGVISPTYASANRHHHRHHHNGSHYASGTKSLRPSPNSANSTLPMTSNGLVYAPVPQRSLSTPPSIAMMPNQSQGSATYVPVTLTSPNSYIGYTAQQQQLAQPMISPPMVGQTPMQGYPFTYAVSPPAQHVASPPFSYPTPNTMYSTASSRPSSSRKHSSSRSRSHNNHYPQIPVQYSYGQGSQSSGYVVPLPNGYTVVVPGGVQNSQNVQYMQNLPPSYPQANQHYDSDSDDSDGPSSFLGSLSFRGIADSLSLKSSKSKRKNR